MFIVVDVVMVVVDVVVVSMELGWWWCWRRLWCIGIGGHGVFDGGGRGGWCSLWMAIVVIGRSCCCCGGGGGQGCCRV